MDRVYLDGVRERTTALLRALITGARSTHSAELQYFIQRIAPVLLGEADRASALRSTL